MPGRYARRCSLAVTTMTLTLALWHPAVNAEGEVPEKCICDIRHQFDSSVKYLPSRSLKDQPGKISIVESSAEYTLAFEAFGKLPIELFLDSEYIGLNEKGAGPAPLPAHLTGTGIGVETTLPFFTLENTYFRFKVMPSFNTDDWDAHASAFRAPVHAYLIYQPDEKWTFVGGVAVYNDFEERIFPILGFIYKPNDKLTFNLVPERPGVSYSLNERLTLFTEGGFSDKEFEVRKDDLKDVILRYRQVYLGAGMRFKITRHIETSLSSGYSFRRYFKYGDSRGKFNLKDDIYSEFRVEIGI